MFSNPSVLPLLDKLGIDECFVYGVFTEFCVKAAIMGLLKTGRRVSLVTEATVLVSSASLEDDELLEAASCVATYSLKSNAGCAAATVGVPCADITEPAPKIIVSATAPRTILNFPFISDISINSLPVGNFPVQIHYQSNTKCRHKLLSSRRHKLA